MRISVKMKGAGGKSNTRKIKQEEAQCKMN